MSKRSLPNTAAASAAASSSSAAAGSDPSKRPRHFHAGPNPREAQQREEEEEKQPVAPDPSPIRRLHRHALESILGFSRDDDLSRALRVSKEWNAAVLSMKNAGLEIDLYNLWPEEYVSFFASPLLRHIGRLVNEYDSEDALSSEFFTQLAQRATELFQLQCRCQLPPEPTALVFPSKLKSVSLTVSPSGFAQINTLLTSLNTLQLLEDLTLDFVLWVQPEVDFALLHPAALTRLSLTLQDDEQSQDDDVSLTHAQLDSFRAPFFANLQQFRIPDLGTPLLKYLVRTPHAIRWKEIADLPIHRWREDNAAVWTSLGDSLTTLSLWPTVNISFLPQLKCLTELSLSVRNCSGQPDSEPWTLPAEIVLVSLIYMSKLTKLTLHAPFDAMCMGGLLRRIPLLTELVLHVPLELESLKFFTLCQATQTTLTSLTLRSHRRMQMHIHEVVHLLCLKSLATLDLPDQFIEPMDSLGRALFDLPSIAGA